jgi:hypothetical protein
MTSLNTSIQVPPDILFHELSGEAVLLNLETGKYFGLDEVGTRMWLLLTEHSNLLPAYQALLQEYEVEEDQLQTDLIHLVDELALHGLLLVTPAPEPN